MATSKATMENAKSSDVYDESPNPCQPCSFEDKTVSSERFCMDCQEYLCTKCSGYHSALKATRKHKLVPREEAQEVVKDKCSAKCTVHTDKTVKYFCKTHSYLGCSVCMTVKHKQCDDVEYILTLAEDVKTNDSVEKFCKQLEAIEAACKAGISDIQENLKVIDTDTHRLKNAMQKFRRKVIGDLDKMEKELMMEATAIKEVDKKKLYDLNEKLSKHQTDVNAMNKQIDTLQQSGRNCDTFYLMKKETERLMSLNLELIETLRDQRHQRYTFQPNNPGKQMGKLSCQQERSDCDSVLSALSQHIDGPTMSKLLKPDTKVRRGKDCTWGNLDDCGLGTIIGPAPYAEGQFLVRSDKDFRGQNKYIYRMGAQDAYDLQIIW